MRIIADTHTHTIASGHAFSTLTENIGEAKKKKLKFLAVTDHTGAMPNAPKDIYFGCQGIYPDQYDGIYLIRGCEANILNANGDLDLPEDILKKLEWVIASFHDTVFPPDRCDRETCTETWINIAKNPHVDVIGHCGDQRYAFDHLPALKAFKEYGKIVEINAHSFAARPGSPVNCREIAKLCKTLSIPVVVSSDAHFHINVGHFAAAVKMLQEIEFPEELVLNSSFERFANTIAKKTGRVFQENIQ